MDGRVDGASGSTTRYVAGALFGLASVTIWAGWMSVTRLGVTTSLSVYDMTMLRFGTAGLVLLPVLLREGLGLDRVAAWRLLVLICGAGAPYAVVANMGLRTTPAAEAGVLIPGVMPLFVALISALLLAERFARVRKIGYALISVGVVLIAGVSAAVSGISTGHLLCLSAAFIWACYAVVLKQSRSARCMRWPSSRWDRRCCSRRSIWPSMA
ncbi:DMT family transporter [Xanthobacter sp. KR7-65]|uniref:DMT family transporter n=1 Tax=Xanthobacter sp. KR7-65 TaxID=3156612 RepID=UPI0032B5F218